MLKIILYSLALLQIPQIPSEVLAKFQLPDFSKKYEIEKAAIPLFLFGDFNGDRMNDVVFPIRSIKTGRKGLAFAIKGRRQPIVVGADVLFSNRKGMDPSVPLDEWRVVPKAEIQQLADDVLSCKGDAIFAEEDEAGSGLICLTRRGIYWIQLGD